MFKKNVKKEQNKKFPSTIPEITTFNNCLYFIPVDFYLLH